MNSLVVVKVVNNSQLKNSPEFREAKRKIVRVIGEAMLSKDTQYGYDGELHKKYDLPKRLERNRVSNKKLSEWHGRRTEGFTGIISKSIDSELKP